MIDIFPPHLARSANLPERLYISLALISSLFFITRSKAISVSTEPIFTIFSPNGRYLREFSWSGPVFFRFLKGRCHGNQFRVIPDLFARSRGISGSAGLIFTIFAPSGRYLMADDQSNLLFPDILRDVAMATNLVTKMKQNYLPPALIALSFRYWMGYRLGNVHVNSANEASKSC